jgi:hypothetical protein
MPDRIEETLTALRVDADRVGLADSGAVRRRGDQRTRNQAIGSGLAVLAVLAGVVGIGGELTGDDRSIQGPPAEQPSVSTTQESVVTLADDPLLRAEDIRGLGPHTGWQRSPEGVSASMRTRCVSSPETWGAGRVDGAQYYEELDGLIVEYALEFDTAARAAAAVRQGMRELATCPPGDPAEVTVVDRGDEAVAGVGDEAYHASRLSTPTADAGIHYYELGTARTGNVVVVLEWTGMGNPVGEGPADWVWTAERLQTALETAVR